MGCKPKSRETTNIKHSLKYHGAQLFHSSQSAICTRQFFGWNRPTGEPKRGAFTLQTQNFDQGVACTWISLTAKPDTSGHKAYISCGIIPYLHVLQAFSSMADKQPRKITWLPNLLRKSGWRWLRLHILLSPSYFRNVQKNTLLPPSSLRFVNFVWHFAKWSFASEAGAKWKQ